MAYQRAPFVRNGLVVENASQTKDTVSAVNYILFKPYDGIAKFSFRPQKATPHLRVHES